MTTRSQLKAELASLEAQKRKLLRKSLGSTGLGCFAAFLVFFGAIAIFVLEKNGPMDWFYVAGPLTVGYLIMRYQKRKFDAQGKEHGVTDADKNEMQRLTEKIAAKKAELESFA